MLARVLAQLWRRRRCWRRWRRRRRRRWRWRRTAVNSGEPRPTVPAVRANIAAGELTAGASVGADVVELVMARIKTPGAARLPVRVYTHGQQEHRRKPLHGRNLRLWPCSACSRPRREHLPKLQIALTRGEHKLQKEHNGSYGQRQPNVVESLSPHSVASPVTCVAACRTRSGYAGKVTAHRS